jgi:hypothetical protein
MAELNNKTTLERAKEHGAFSPDGKEVRFFHVCELDSFLSSEKAQLKPRIATIQEMFSNALQSDLEHGVKCLNENASKEFHEKYPELTAALRRLSDME